jgi:hypothetical protein
LFGSSSLRGRPHADHLGQGTTRPNQETIVSIGTISSNTSVQFQGVASQQKRGKEPSLDNTAKLLGVSSDDLKSQLKSGKTLNDIASAQGVSSDDLLSALKTDLKANKPADAPELSDDQLTQMATGIAAGKGPGRAGGHHGHGHGGPPPVSTSTDDSDATTAEANLKQMSSALGLSQSDLLSKLSSGVSFSSMLGTSASNPYTASQFAVSGGLAVDAYA